MKIILLGTAWPYRGGIAAHNERLAGELQRMGHDVTIYNFTLQYPSFLFPGKTQYSTSPAPEHLHIVRRLHSCNPFNWLCVGREIRRARPDLLIVPFWLPFMGASLGTVMKIAKQPATRIVAVLDNLIPHEPRPGDRLLTTWYCRPVDAFVAMVSAVEKDIDKFRCNIGKPRVISPHPLYDQFGATVSHEEACTHLGLDPTHHYFLFFGLIRDYKGLDLLLAALAQVNDLQDYRLIVAGEFYGNGEKYLRQAHTLNLDERIIWRTEYIPDNEVRYYFSAAQLIVQPYKTATQSGVTQIAYHFVRPMLVTAVGGLPEMVPHGKVGYVVPPKPDAIASALTSFIQQQPDFSPGILEEKKKYGWDVLAHNILTLASSCK